MLFSNKNLEAKILLARLLVSEPKVEQKNMETLNVFFLGGGWSWNITQKLKYAVYKLECGSLVLKKAKKKIVKQDAFVK